MSQFHSKRTYKTHKGNNQYLSGYIKTPLKKSASLHSFKWSNPFFTWKSFTVWNTLLLKQSIKKKKNWIIHTMLGIKILNFKQNLIFFNIRWIPLYFILLIYITSRFMPTRSRLRKYRVFLSPFSTWPGYRTDNNTMQCEPHSRSSSCL